MNRDDFNNISNTLPRTPGVYMFVDKAGTPIYIGKAKNLKNRLSSYFIPEYNLRNKTRVMIKNAVKINWTVVQSEADALILESTWIKQHMPRYNVMLKDGKSYGYICIKNERFPRVFFTREINDDGSTYFGPYTSKWRAKILLKLIKDLFPLRTCNLNLSEENVDTKKYKVCLEYHIENCLGPCVGKESEADYNQKINQIKHILKGQFKPVKDHLMAEIHELAAKMKFEKAQELKEKLIAFDDYQAKSTVVNPSIKNCDVFTVELDEDYAFVNFIKIINGAIINTHTEEVNLKIDMTESDILDLAIPALRERFNSNAPEILVNYLPEWVAEGITVTVPKIGDKKKLVDLSVKNIKFNKLQFFESRNKIAQAKNHSHRILNTMKSDLKMDVLPKHIECFDNSNFQGSNSVASCVVFRNAKPAKSEYRHFHIKTVEGQNDFAFMEEIVYRRYKRLLEENQSLPDLIITDGGKGQLSSAMKSLNKLGIADKITVIGIAKRLEEIFFPGDSIPIYIDKKSESLKVIQKARNEAHRFAITFHRDQRSKRVHKTELTEIKGVGEKTAQKLLTSFKSVKNIENASQDELSTIVGPALGQNIFKHFKRQKSKD